MLWYLGKPNASLPTAFKIKSWILTKGEYPQKTKRPQNRVEHQQNQSCKRYRLQNRTRTSKWYVLNAPTKSRGVKLRENG